MTPVDAADVVIAGVMYDDDEEDDDEDDELVALPARLLWSIIGCTILRLALINLIINKI